MNPSPRFDAAKAAAVEAEEEQCTRNGEINLNSCI